LVASRNLSAPHPDISGAGPLGGFINGMYIMKRILFLCFLANLFWLRAIFAQNIYSFPFSVGDKWFYNTTFQSSPGFIVREIINITSDGFRVVSVKSQYRSGYITSGTEYWYHDSVNYYILFSPSLTSGDLPIFISNLKKDSSISPYYDTYSWHNDTINYFGKTYNSQISSFSYYMGRNGYTTLTYRITDELGLTQTVIRTGSGTETTNLIGMIKNNTLIGDSGATILSIKDENQIPRDIILNQNYPNPFNPTTIISYSIPERLFVSLKIYNILGEEVSVLVNSIQNKGEHKEIFDASKVSGGIYIYKLQIDNSTYINKCVYLK
jgi:hypothetical protein